MPEWRVDIHRIGASAAAVLGDPDRLDAELEPLLKYLDQDDVLVAYAAKEELQKILDDDRIIETQCVTRVVKAILTTSDASWRREASGFRFQLLRQLLNVKTGNSSKGEDQEHRVDCGVEFPYLQEITENVQQVGSMVRSVFLLVDRSERGAELLPPIAAPCSVQYEALVLMIAVVKRIGSSEKIDCFQVELSKEMIVLVDDVFMAMDYASQPTFVSCAVLKLLGGFQDLINSWVRLAQTDDDVGCLKAVYSKWLDRCFAWSLQSSCTSTALQLLDVNENAATTSECAFVTSSGRYPFLQQWLLCVSRMGIAYMEESLRKNDADRDKLRSATMSGESYRITKAQVSRKQLFTVLAEQDDTMIEVLNNLARMTTFARIPSIAQLRPSFAAYIAAEFDPDLLFADLVATLGQDHLVLLDLLVSDETQMLEYIMQYLRHLDTQWGTSKQKLQSCQRLEGVMGVLIQLRLEIDRLAAADLFPYGAGPLTRRLLAIEQLYEESER
uniref:Uncharacterized protein n=1 Tax=Peronospora matthiolae TaxID=2874970 RepID=A0AAV1TJI3_9STRA